MTPSLSYCGPEGRNTLTMLNETELATALEIVMGGKDPEEFACINDRLCRQFPNITTEDLVSLWREAGERQMAEADELEAWGRQRRTQ